MTKAKKSGGGADRPAGRTLHERVRTAKGRRLSSTRWLERQLNDPYVQAARREGFRSRAAYKLAELDDRFHFLKSGMRIVDLGATPGGWSQIAAERVKAGQGKHGGSVLAVDCVPMDAINHVDFIHADITDEDVAEKIIAALDGLVDVVLSDMAPPSSGHRGTDHLRIIGLAEEAAWLAAKILKPGGVFIAKVWQGGTESDLLNALKRDFAKVRHAKPKASRSDSAEIYVIASEFRGNSEDPDTGS